jgi:chaperonin cofactor prefoldin
LRLEGVDYMRETVVKEFLEGLYKREMNVIELELKKLQEQESKIKEEITKVTHQLSKKRKDYDKGHCKT